MILLIDFFLLFFDVTSIEKEKREKSIDNNTKIREKKEKNLKKNISKFNFTKTIRF